MNKFFNSIFKHPWCCFWFIYFPLHHITLSWVSPCNIVSELPNSLAPAPIWLWIIALTAYILPLAIIYKRNDVLNRILLGGFVFLCLHLSIALIISFMPTEEVGIIYLAAYSFSPYAFAMGIIFADLIAHVAYSKTNRVGADRKK